MSVWPSAARPPSTEAESSPGGLLGAPVRQEPPTSAPLHTSVSLPAHLQPSFDPNPLTVNELASILSAHGISVPTSRQKKEVYLGLFVQHIVAQRDVLIQQITQIKPSADGVVFVGKDGTPSVLKNAGELDTMSATGGYGSSPLGEPRNSSSAILNGASVTKPSASQSRHSTSRPPLLQQRPALGPVLVGNSVAKVENTSKTNQAKSAMPVDESVLIKEEHVDPPRAVGGLLGVPSSIFCSTSTKSGSGLASNPTNPAHIRSLEKTSGVSFATEVHKRPGGMAGTAGTLPPMPLQQPQASGLAGSPTNSALAMPHQAFINNHRFGNAPSTNASVSTQQAMSLPLSQPRTQPLSHLTCDPIFETVSPRSPVKKAGFTSEGPCQPSMNKQRTIISCSESTPESRIFGSFSQPSTNLRKTIKTTTSSYRKDSRGGFRLLFGQHFVSNDPLNPFWVGDSGFQSSEPSFRPVPPESNGANSSDEENNTCENVLKLPTSKSRQPETQALRNTRQQDFAEDLQPVKRRKVNRKLTDIKISNPAPLVERSPRLANMVPDSKNEKPGYAISNIRSQMSLRRFMSLSFLLIAVAAGLVTLWCILVSKSLEYCTFRMSDDNSTPLMNRYKSHSREPGTIIGQLEILMSQYVDPLFLMCVPCPANTVCQSQTVVGCIGGDLYGMEGTSTMPMDAQESYLADAIGHLLDTSDSHAGDILRRILPFPFAQKRCDSRTRSTSAQNSGTPADTVPLDQSGRRSLVANNADQRGAPIRWRADPDVGIVITTMTRVASGRPTAVIGLVRETPVGQGPERVDSSSTYNAQSVGDQEHQPFKRYHHVHERVPNKEVVDIETQHDHRIWTVGVSANLLKIIMSSTGSLLAVHRSALLSVLERWAQLQPISEQHPCRPDHNVWHSRASPAKNSNIKDLQTPSVWERLAWVFIVTLGAVAIVSVWQRVYVMQVEHYQIANIVAEKVIVTLAQSTNKDTSIESKMVPVRQLMDQFLPVYIHGNKSDRWRIWHLVRMRLVEKEAVVKEVDISVSVHEDAGSRGQHKHCLSPIYSNNLLKSLRSSVGFSLLEDSSTDDPPAHICWLLASTKDVHSWTT